MNMFSEDINDGNVLENVFDILFLEFSALRAVSFDIIDHSIEKREKCVLTDFYRIWECLAAQKQNARCVRV